MRAVLVITAMLLLGAGLSTVCSAHDARWATVTSIYDCDTLAVNLETIVIGSEATTVPMPVRLRGVSAPERTGPEKPLGLKCRERAIARWLKVGDRVELVGPFTWDPRRRLVARVILPSGRDLGAELIRLGWGLPWDYPNQGRPGFDPGGPYPIGTEP